MRGLGLNFQKGRFRVSVLDRDDEGNVGFHSSRVVTVDAELPIPELMDRYAAQLKIQFDEFQPDLVAARQIWDAGGLEATVCQIAPFAIAAYVCCQKNIPFRHFTPQALRQPTRFG